MNPVVFGFMVILPIAALWMTKAFLQLYFQLPDSLGYSNLVPVIYGFALIYILLALNLVPFTSANFFKIYGPIILVTLVLTFVFAGWSKGYFESNGYTQCQPNSLKERLFSVRFEKNPGKCK